MTGFFAGKALLVLRLGMSLFIDHFLFPGLPAADHMPAPAPLDGEKSEGAEK